LVRLQKVSDQFAFTAYGRAGEFAKPSSGRHFGFGVEPFGKPVQLDGGNVALLNLAKQILGGIFFNSPLDHWPDASYTRAVGSKLTTP
jgi:hypothetical protein